jgi:hypothetical protein
MLVANPQVDSAVKLDLRLTEADQIATPNLGLKGDFAIAVDGIVFDGYGNPLEDYLLKSHPGDRHFTTALDHDAIPAASMIHYFRMDRPGQHRGIPEITPALPLFAQLRRYTLAVIAAAETAADFAAVLSTDAPANGESQDSESRRVSPRTTSVTATAITIPRNAPRERLQRTPTTVRPAMAKAPTFRPLRLATNVRNSSRSHLNRENQKETNPAFVRRPPNVRPARERLAARPVGRSSSSCDRGRPSHRPRTRARRVARYSPQCIFLGAWRTGHAVYRLDRCFSA